MFASLLLYGDNLGIGVNQRLKVFLKLLATRNPQLATRNSQLAAIYTSVMFYG